MRSSLARTVSAWPAEMRADLTAAFLDYPTTGKLIAAIRRGEAPPPTATRLFNGRKVPVWSRAACEVFVARRHDLSDNGASFDDLHEVELA
jgi:hypothetical protein